MELNNDISYKCEFTPKSKLKLSKRILACLGEGLRRKANYGKTDIKICYSWTY